MQDEELEALAQEKEAKFVRRSRTIEDFRFDESQEKYWDTTTGNLLGAKAVDGAIPLWDWPKNAEGKPIRPSVAINNIDTGLTVEGSTWWPGREKFIRDVVITDRGAIKINGASCYNSYIPPSIGSLKSSSSPERWIEHVKKIYPEAIEHEHFFNFCAHAVQRPDEKVSHGVVMAGFQGIGKDTALMPVRRGVGEWNAAEIGPDVVTQAYNGYVKSVLLVINEVRPHDEDFKAANFYNLLKPILASPPDMLPMTVKYANTIYVRNLAHVILTTNEPLGMFIPPDDRRLFIMWSPLDDPQSNGSAFHDKYFIELHQYLNNGGCDAATQWLLQRDISAFEPSRPPPTTRGKQAIMDSARQVRRTLVDDVFEAFCEKYFDKNKPKVVFHRDLTAFVSTANLFDDAAKAVALLNAKNFHFKMSERGYDMARNPDGTEWANGKWRTRMAFVRKEVPQEQRLTAITEALTLRPL